MGCCLSIASANLRRLPLPAPVFQHNNIQGSCAHNLQSLPLAGGIAKFHFGQGGVVFIDEDFLRVKLHQRLQVGSNTSRLTNKQNLKLFVFHE